MAVKWSISSLFFQEEKTPIFWLISCAASIKLLKSVPSAVNLHEGIPLSLLCSTTAAGL